MKPESRRRIHMGINYIMVPAPAINAQNFLRFQEALIDCSVEFTNSARSEQPHEHRIDVTRDQPTPLNIGVIASTTQPTGQLLIVAPHPGRTLEYFIQETEQIVEAFMATWQAPNRQVVKSDVTLRDLYETTGEHAFQELWEERLRMCAEELAILGTPVLGGGLRFVIPSQPDRPAQIEVKIESYLRDTSKFFVETQFNWLEPRPPGELLDPRRRLNEVEGYVKEHVLPFMLGRRNGGDD